MKLHSGLVAVALAATTIAPTLTQPAYAAPVQAAGPTADRAVQAGASWLTGQLTDGLVFNDQYGGFNDYGLSADFAFALYAAGR